MCDVSAAVIGYLRRVIDHWLGRRCLYLGCYIYFCSLHVIRVSVDAKKGFTARARRRLVGVLNRLTGESETGPHDVTDSPSVGCVHAICLQKTNPMWAGWGHILGLIVSGCWLVGWLSSSANCTTGELFVGFLSRFLSRCLLCHITESLDL